METEIRGRGREMGKEEKRRRRKLEQDGIKNLEEKLPDGDGWKKQKNQKDVRKKIRKRGRCFQK